MADLDAVVGQIDKDEEGIVVPILDKAGKPYLAADGTPATITGYGTESKTYRTRRDARYRELAGDEGEVPRDVAKIIIAAAAVKSWHGWEVGGSPLEPTSANVERLFAVEHIRLQFEAGIDRNAGFFGAGSAG